MEKFKKVFKISELVCPHSLQYPENQAWGFMDPRALETLYVIRTKILNVRMFINQGSVTQRGLRCNLCALVKEKTAKNRAYLSSHVLGKGFDFIPEGMTAEQARKKIEANKHLLPHNIRLEKNVSWVHFDLANFSGDKIQYFAG